MKNIHVFKRGNYRIPGRWNDGLYASKQKDLPPSSNTAVWVQNKTCSYSCCFSWHVVCPAWCPHKPGKANSKDSKLQVPGEGGHLTAHERAVVLGARCPNRKAKVPLKIAMQRYAYMYEFEQISIYAAFQFIPIESKHVMQ